VRDVSNECDHEDQQRETMTRNRVETLQKKNTSMQRSLDLQSEVGSTLPVDNI